MTAPSSRPIPAVPVNAETATYWEAAQSGRLMLARCGACRALHHYPRALCPRCLGDQVSLEPASGGGTIYSVSVMRRGPDTPYAIAYVRLDEGVTVLTNIVDADLDALRIGQRVRLVFQVAAGGQQVPMFTVDEAPGSPGGARGVPPD